MKLLQINTESRNKQTFPDFRGFGTIMDYEIPTPPAKVDRCPEEAAWRRHQECREVCIRDDRLAGRQAGRDGRYH